MFCQSQTILRNVKLGRKFGTIKFEVFGINSKETLHTILARCFRNDARFALNAKFFARNVKYLHETLHDYSEKLNTLQKKNAKQLHDTFFRTKFAHLFGVVIRFRVCK